MKRVVITGATGAVGTALINELLEKDVEILVLVWREIADKHLFPQNPLLTVVPCSLDELNSFDNPTDQPYEVFYHLAWAGTTGAGRDDMFLQCDNIRYALDAVALAKRMGCSKFVGVGSQAEYGRVSGKLTADTPAFPEMGYAYGKLCAGLMTRDLAHQIGLEHVWTRILSIYGPMDTPNSLIMSTILKLQSGEIPKLTPGEQKWDYLFSGDAAKALRLLGEKGIDGKTYVLGSGKTRTIREYVEAIRDIVSPGAPLDFGGIPYSPKQVMYLCADTTDLENDLGWHAETSFELGIKTIIA